MTRKVTASVAKAQLLALLDEAAAGDEIEITKHGRTVARLVGSGGPSALRGALADIAGPSAEDEELFTAGLEWTLS